MRANWLFPLCIAGCVDGKDTAIDIGTTEELTHGDCYQGGGNCTTVSWSDIELLIDTVFAFDSEYAGYTKSEATTLARSLYNDGVVPGAWLRVVKATDHGDGTWTVWVAAADSDGYARTDLSADDFTVDEGDASGVVTDLTRVSDLSGDTTLRVSLVLDDSGSVTDCDARGVADGLSSLLSTLPPSWEGHLVKFDDQVFVLSDWTRDTDALAERVANTCTSRGGTAAWDAGVTGISAFSGASGNLELQILFTDGLDNASARTARDYRQAAMDAQVPVFVAALGIPDIFELSRLAQRTGGGLVYVKNGDRVGAVFDTLSDYVGNTMKLEIQASAGATFTVSADGVSDTVNE